MSLVLCGVPSRCCDDTVWLSLDRACCSTLRSVALVGALSQHNNVSRDRTRGPSLPRCSGAVAGIVLIMAARRGIAAHCQRIKCTFCSCLSRIQMVFRYITELNPQQRSTSRDTTGPCMGQDQEVQSAELVHKAGTSTPVEATWNTFSNRKETNHYVQ